MNSVSANTTRGGWRPRIATDRRSMMVADILPNFIIVCQSAKMWVCTCCRALNSTVLGPTVCSNLLLCRILLLGCWTPITAAFKDKWCIQHSDQWSTPISWHSSCRSYLDSIASIFVNCSSIADQETLIWNENVRFQCSCGTVSFLY